MPLDRQPDGSSPLGVVQHQYDGHLLPRPEVVVADKSYLFLVRRKYFIASGSASSLCLLMGLGFFRWAHVVVGALDNREARVFGTQLVLRCTDAARLQAADKRLRERLVAKGIPV